MKDKLKWIGVIGVIAGTVLSRVIGSFYGSNGKVVIFGTIVAVLLFLILYYLAKKKYLETIRGVGIILPLIIGFAGMYLDNIYLLLGGIALIFITIPITTKVTSKFKDNSHR